MKDNSLLNIPKLGFGLMRLPKKDDKIDVEATKEMVDSFMDAGLNYFDTAYVYDGGESEKAAKLALVDRYPRESYYLATKLNPWFKKGTTEEEAKKQFETSLERTGAGYFDFYLLHAIQENNHNLFDDFDLWNFVKKLKEEGKVKHYGFSYHSNPELLDKLLTEHPDVDFIQLQINYADWDNPDVQSRENLEVAKKHNVPVVIMEPVKGGALANPPEDVTQLLKEYNPDASYASWAIRFAAGLDNIITVLSGMSSPEQMQDNLSYMKDFKPLNEEELEIIDKAQKILSEEISIPCTACHYCADGCPQEIPIPEIFSAMNRYLLWDRLDEAKTIYNQVVEGKGKASDCIECEQCVAACPQQIDVVDKLKEVAELFD